MCQKSIKYWVFDDPSHIKRSFWCQGWWKHQAQYFFWWNEGEEVIEAKEAVEAVEVIEASEVLRSEKSLLRTSVSSRFLNLALLWCFEKRNVLVESWKCMSNFSTLSVRGCWGQPILFFWKLVDKTQISKPPKPTRHHNSIKLWILLTLRAELLYILQSETPCKAWNQSWICMYVFDFLNSTFHL